MAQQLHHILQPFIMKLQRFFVILLVSEESLLYIVYLLYKWRVNTTYGMAHREMTFLLNNIHSRIKRDILNFFHTNKKKLQVVIPSNLNFFPYSQEEVTGSHTQQSWFDSFWHPSTILSTVCQSGYFLQG